MKTIRSLVLETSLLAGLCLMSGCAELADPYNGGYYGGGDPYYGSSYDDYEYRRTRRERWELERERERLEDERERLEREREEAARNPYVPPPPPPPSRPAPSQDRCPAGFSPSERKCTPQERRGGCKDIRLPSGLGCVRR